jgi:hypothetical protein
MRALAYAEGGLQRAEEAVSAADAALAGALAARGERAPLTPAGVRRTRKAIRTGLERLAAARRAGRARCRPA